MWTEILKTDSKEQYLTTMYAMDSEYSNILSADRINHCIDNKRGRFYVYNETDFAIVISFKYSNAIDMYKIMHIGISGKADPAICAKIISDKMVEFAKENNLEVIYAIKPLKMDNVEVLKVHDEMLKFPWVYKDEVNEEYIKVRFEPKEAI